MKAKERRKMVFTTIICFFVISLCVIASINSIVMIRTKTQEKKELTEKLSNLKEEETILKEDVEKLKNPEYAARYAREKYLYSKYGEKILKID